MHENPAFIGDDEHHINSNNNYNKTSNGTYPPIELSITTPTVSI